MKNPYNFKCMVCKADMTLQKRSGALYIVCNCGREIDVAQAKAQMLYPFAIVAGAEPVAPGATVEV